MSNPEPGTARLHTYPAPTARHDRHIVMGRPGTAQYMVAENAREETTLAHMRNTAHDTALCNLCTMGSELRTAHLRRINADRATAEIALDLIRAEATLDSIISG